MKNYQVLTEEGIPEELHENVLNVIDRVVKVRQRIKQHVETESLVQNLGQIEAVLSENPNAFVNK